MCGSVGDSYSDFHLLGGLLAEPSRWPFFTLGRRYLRYARIATNIVMMETAKDNFSYHDIAHHSPFGEPPTHIG